MTTTKRDITKDELDRAWILKASADGAAKSLADAASDFENKRNDIQNAKRQADNRAETTYQNALKRSAEKQSKDMDEVAAEEDKLIQAAANAQQELIDYQDEVFKDTGSLITLAPASSGGGSVSV